MGNRFFYRQDPVEAMRQLNLLDDAVQNSITASSANAVAAGNNASLAAGSATAAAAAKDAALAAWQAATAPSEQLAAFSQVAHSGSVVAAFLYNTGSDSDGGEWRKRCLHTSWYNEAIVPGKWLGIVSDTPPGSWAANVDAAGGANGDYFQMATDQAFYRVNDLAAKSASYVYRGNSREFPALALIIVEAARVVIYDATKPGCPMWMVFTSSTAAWPNIAMLGRSIAPRGCIAAVNGEIFVGSSTSSSECLVRISFVSDSAKSHSSQTNQYVWPGNIASRNSLLSVKEGDTSVAAIIHSTTNSVAVIVLPDAPVDPATGLQVPTIYASTAIGVSRIAHDGTVSSTASSSNNGAIWVDGRYARVLAQAPFGVACSWPVSDPLPAGSGAAGSHINSYWLNTYYPGTNLSIFDGNSVGVKCSFGGSKRLSVVKENPSAPSKGMLAKITNTYNTGWMVGDIRGCWMADTVAGSLVGGTVADRSVKSKSLNVIGTLTKAAVATGSQLVGCSGWTAANYAEQPYNSDLDYGTGDCLIFKAWVVLSAVTTVNNCLMHRCLSGQSGGVMLVVDATGALLVYLSNNTGYSLKLTSSAFLVKNVPTLVEVSRSGGTLLVRTNGGVTVGAVADSTDISYPNAVLRIGVRQDGANPVQGKMALVHSGATPPSADQIAQIYRDELRLFQPGAQCTIDGNSSAVTALARDDAADLLQVGTSWGRTSFCGLVRVDSAATQVGSVQSIAAGCGAHITAGASGGRYTQPAITLRDELRRKDEAKRAAAKELITVDYDFTPGQTTQRLPYGFTLKNAFVGGARKRNGSTKDYTVSYDGYSDSITFGVAPLASGQSGTVWVQIDMNRRSA